jgi:DNA-binding transcriptional LysR family regulator
MDLNALALFAKVVEAGSFSEAARRVKMPLASVSRRVAELEEGLGVRLLERSTRKLRLTSIGGQLIAQARCSIDIGQAVDSIVSDHQSAVRGLLRVSAPASVELLVSQLVATFQAAYPELRVHLAIGNKAGDDIDDDLDFRIGMPKDSVCVARKLLRYRHRLVASPEYLIKHTVPLTPPDLLKHPLLTFALDSTEEHAWRLNDSVTGIATTVAFNPSFTIDSFSGLAAGLLAGSGIGELPPALCDEHLKHGKLMEVLPRWHLDVAELVLLHRRDRHSPKAVQLFKDFALKRVLSMTHKPVDAGLPSVIRPALDFAPQPNRRTTAIASIA